ncbi:OmpP1/FadL family transporter [Candidatus Zixiibacteriota bacterium]
MSRARAFLGLCAVGLMLALPLSSAQAGAFSIFEQGARAMGRASAFAAAPDDPSAIFYNPGGLAFVEGTQAYIGGTLIMPSGKFYGTDPFPGYGVEEEQSFQLFTPPAVYLSHQLNDRMVVGIGIHTPFGLGTKWENPETFSGRFVSTNAQIAGVSINPTVAFKLMDNLAIGVGVDIRVSKITLEQYAPGLNPNTNTVINVAEATIESDMNSAIGWNVGVLFKATDQLSFGLAYRAPVTLNYTGKAQFEQIASGDAFFDAAVAAKLGGTSAEYDMEADFNYPGYYTVAAAYQLTDDLLVEVDYIGFQWSVFDKLEATGLSQPGTNQLDDISIDENYEDAFVIRVGAEWWKSDTFALRCGYLYDKSPVPHETISPMLPDADRNGFTAGFGTMLGNMTLDVAVMYLRFKEADTMGEQHGGFNGVYDNAGWLFGTSLGIPIGH